LFKQQDKGTEEMITEESTEYGWLQQWQKVAEIMDHDYNNLKYRADQIKFINHLLFKSGLVVDDDTPDSMQIINELFKDNLYNACYVLLQSMSPIRFGFLDGQGRATSMNYFGRQVLPCPISGMKSLMSNCGKSDLSLKAKWSLVETGAKSQCAFWTQDHLGTVETMFNNAFCSEARKRSKQTMDRYMKQYGLLGSIAQSNLGDVINSYQNGRISRMLGCGGGTKV
jgi:hypothetical protein